MTKVPLVYASTNRAKIAEARRILAHFGIALDDLTTAQVAAGLEKLPQIVEPESTYEGNALEKAVGYARMLRRPCLSDDSGVEIQELGCLPGVYTANFGFTRVKDALTPDLPYAASFVCCVAYAEPTGRSVCVTERLNGFVRFPPNAQAPASSVPYSYFFIPEGGTESLAVLTSRPGGFLSHRVMALSKLCHSLGLGTGD